MSREVHVNRLKEGMILLNNVVSEHNDILLHSDTILTEKLIESLKKHNINKVKVADKGTVVKEPLEIIKKDTLLIFNEFLRKLVPAEKNANPSDRIVTISHHVENLFEDILRKYTLLEFLVRMKLLDDNWLYLHSIKTSMLSMLIGSLLNLNEKQLKNLGAAALIHDIGLGEMPGAITPEVPDNSKEEMWFEHPYYGYQICNEMGIERKICELILYHHERWDGEGFPKGLKGEEIPLGSRIIAVAETYDSLIREDKYPYHEVIEFFYGTGNIFYDCKIIETFTSNIAIYPLGSLVRLSTGDVGIVVNVRKNKGPRPIVRIYYNRFNREYNEPYMVDLGQEKTVFIKECFRVGLE